VHGLDGVVMAKTLCVFAAWVLILLSVAGCSRGDPTPTPVPLNVVALDPTEVVVLPTASPTALNVMALEATEVLVPPTASPTPLKVLALEATEAVVLPTASPAPLNTVTLEATEVAVLPTATPAATAKTEGLRITILYDNTTYDPRLTADWGFAALVEYQGHTLLFDTGGNPNILLRNMELMAVDPMSIEAVVLSHSHGDHTGGMAGLVRIGARPPVYVPPSIGGSLKRQVTRTSELVEVEPGQEILPGIFTTGEMGAGQVPEQALVIQLEDGIVVVTGCAHPGIVEIVARAKELSGGPVRLVLGGFHLGSKSASQIRSIVDDFRQLGVEQVAPAHCTGERAIAMFAAAYGDSYVQAGAGRVIVVESRP
jgi:7,8-dihydropterin-6-yl-methyl-4-(beta-D-ribofuranosyl)aminobenzene 5'-phosphate synthase